jgi:predicted esterase
VPANPHLGTKLLTAGAPEAEGRLAVVLVHGRDQGPDVMLDVVRRLRLPDVTYVLPIADGYSWYPGLYTDPMEANEPWITWSLEGIDRAIERAQGPHGTRPVVLLGFSQGACLVAERLARGPVPAPLNAVLTGALMGPADRPMDHLAGTEVFFGTSQRDTWVALEHTQGTVDAFRRAGAECTLKVYEGDEHLVNDDEVATLREMIINLMHERTT